MQMSLLEERVGHMRQQQVTSLKNLALRQYRGHDSAASPSATPDETQGPRSSSEQQGATSRSVPTNFDAKKKETGVAKFSTLESAHPDKNKQLLTTRNSKR
ncbi:hypothetical protein PGTUg99_036641 [Puccinia graminis f. sp. tritici]|uniref:Uncharacterized protein n=1 Tax=Puccinia graminis f. sp. tritici TaxID=56615 RepID=A0A5B0PMH7_PUCGR|nr:hypothetical protein PGTUg99_036641 [Puccinia graminis f. sp. tritici]